MHDLGKGAASRFAAALRSPISPVWASLIITLAALVAGSWIVNLGLRLSSLSAAPAPATGAVPYAVAEIVTEGDGFEIEIQGSIGATVLLIVNGEPARLLSLDEKGRASVTDVEISAATSVEIAALAEPPEPVSHPPTPTRTFTPTSTATQNPTRTPAATATPPTIATATAAPARSPSRTATRPPARSETSPTPTRPARRSTGKKPGAAPPVLHLVTDAGNRIAVTFDGNASSNGTAELLDLLQELDLDITLFVTGGFVERYPTLVRRALLAGHEIGNHTYSHDHLTTYADNHRHNLLPNVTKELFQEQLRRTEAAFREATGRPMAPLWRAPYGEENSTLRAWALELGYLHVRWSSLEGASLDARDWVADEHSNLFQNSRKMMDRLLGFPHLEGGIVLMHLATERSEPPWSELPRFVRELKRRDVRPVKISELLEASRTWRPWLERARENHDRNFPE